MAVAVVISEGAGGTRVPAWRLKVLRVPGETHLQCEEYRLFRQRQRQWTDLAKHRPVSLTRPPRSFERCFSC